MHWPQLLTEWENRRKVQYAIRAIGAEARILIVTRELILREDVLESVYTLNCHLLREVEIARAEQLVHEDEHRIVFVQVRGKEESLGPVKHSGVGGAPLGHVHASVPHEVGGGLLDVVLPRPHHVWAGHALVHLENKFRTFRRK